MLAHHIVVGTKKEASGLTYTVPRMCNGLSSVDVDVQLHVTEGGSMIDQHYTITEYPRLKIASTLGISPKMKSALLQIPSEKEQIIHNHSLWTMPNLYVGSIKSNSRTKFVFSPHGTLTEWALNHSRWKKKLFWYFGQSRVLQQADCFHATAMSEYEDIRRLGYKQPVAIINLGIDLPDINQELSLRDALPKTMLFFARVHPKKGLGTLLEVWQKNQVNFPDWQLVIAGPEDYPGYVNELKQLSKNLNCKRVNFVGPKYGPEKHELFTSASIYILPTHSENFGITVGEALSYGLPSIVTQGAPWEGLEVNNCGWWVANTKNAINDAMRKSMTLRSRERRELGENGRMWMEREFSWHQVGSRLKALYQWLLSGNDKNAAPEFVIFD